MARVIGGNERRSKWWLGAMAVVAVGDLVRLVAGIHSWTDLLFFPVGVAVVALLLLAPGYVIARSQVRRAGRLMEALGARNVWAVQTGMYTTRYLVVTDTSVSLVTRRGEQRRSWPIDQVRQVIVERVPIGAPRTGLRIEFGRHREHETLIMYFPWLAGVWSSSRRAQEAKSALDRVRSAHAVNQHE